MPDSQPRELVSLEFHLEHSPVAVVTWSETGRCLAWSRSAERIFGYTAREVVDQQVLADFHHVAEEDRATLLEWLGRLSRGEISRFSLEHRNIRKDGKVIWCQWHNMVAIGEGPRRFLSYAIDVTDRVHAEQQIRHAREVLESHLNDSPMAVVEWGPEFRIVRWSRGAEQISGMPAGEMIGKSVAEFAALIHPDDLPMLQSRMKRLLSGEWRQASQVYRHIRRDGVVRWVHWHSSALVQAGKVVSVLSHGIDITDRVQAEAELRRARETLESHLNNSPLAIVEWGPDFRFLRWNTGAQRIFGWTEQEMIGTRFDTMEPPLIYAEDKPRVMEHVADLLTGKPARASITARNHRKDGAVRWINWHSSSVFDEHGKLLSLLSQGIDVTEQVLAEQMISAAKERAEAASQAKDRFIAILSHELRTPLTPVRALLSIMRDDPRLPDDIRADLQTVARNVEAESRLIDDLLDVTGLSHGQVHFEMRPCDAHAILEQTLATFAVSAGQKSIRLSAQLDATRATLAGDPQRLGQVFGNLLSNAIKFTPPGGGVTVRTDNPDPRRLRVRVIDTGIGIDREHLPRLFAPFERGEARHRYEYTGLGLGLAIARSLLQLMHGTIEAESGGEGAGATFTVMLPTIDAPAAQSPPTAPGAPARLAATSILLVEDHVATAEILSRLLRRSGHEVVVAGSVAAAVELARGRTLGLLICDIGLPDGTGHDLLRALRGGGQSAPAIALSGYGMAGDIAASKAAGFAEHLTKPVDFPVLEQAIGRLLAR